MEVFAQSVNSGSIDDYSTFVDSTAIPSGYRIGLFFTIITNLALIPSIIITAPFSPAVYDKVTGKKIRKSQKRYFECFILIMTYNFSTLYHGCSYAGNMCTFWWLARRMDHFTAEYVIPMTSLYVLPIYPSRGHRHVAYFITLLVHTVLQITQFATFVFQLVFLVIFICAFAVFHYDNTELFAGVVLASIAIGFYLMPWGRIEPWTHSLWHLFGFVAEYFIFDAVPEPDLFILEERFEKWRVGPFADWAATKSILGCLRPRVLSPLPVPTIAVHSSRKTVETLANAPPAEQLERVVIAAAPAVVASLLVPQPTARRPALSANATTGGHILQGPSTFQFK